MILIFFLDLNNVRRDKVDNVHREKETNFDCNDDCKEAATQLGGVSEGVSLTYVCLILPLFVFGKNMKIK